MKKILVFPCGSEVGLEIHRSLCNSKDFELVGLSSVKDHGQFVYKNYIDNFPFIEDKLFIIKLNDLIVKEKIDLIFPAHDSVLLKLSENKNKIKAKIIASDKETCILCRSKKDTYSYFQKDIKTPRIYGAPSFVKEFPVFLKPEIGQGSRGTMKADNMEELKLAINKDPSLMIMEYLPGKEYTIECFTNRKGNLIYVRGRERARISNGISVNSKNIENINFGKIAKKINDQIKLRGVWFFQLKENSKGELSLLEIEPRVAGTMALSRVQGVNLPLLTVYDYLDKDVSIIKNKFSVEIDRALESKYKHNLKYQHVYVDFDDTLIVDKKINLPVLTFLYQCLNEKKHLYLLTKHKKNIIKSILSYKINPDIFSKIIRIDKEDKKHKHIVHKNSIFIDDSFSERKEVSVINKIPVFDIDSLECLLK